MRSKDPIDLSTSTHLLDEISLQGLFPVVSLPNFDIKSTGRIRIVSEAHDLTNSSPAEETYVDKPADIVVVAKLCILLQCIEPSIVNAFENRLVGLGFDRLKNAQSQRRT